MEKSQGKLIANIGMSLDEVRQKSSLKLAEGNYTTLVSSDVVFDFEPAGSPKLQFLNCQYYLLRTDDNQKLVEINIGIAPRKLNWVELGKLMREAEYLLVNDGWKPAHYKEGITAQESMNKTLAGTAPLDRFNVGYTWGKGAVALTLSAKLMHKADFISFLKLEPRENWEKSANPFGHTLP
jgi:hypothetical protein